MLLKVTFTSREKEENRRSIIDTILRLYAVDGVIETHYDSEKIQWELNIRRDDMPALRQDVLALRICGFDLAGTEL